MPDTQKQLNKKDIKYHTRTIKLKIILKADSPEGRKERWNRIYEIMSDRWKAANWIASGQYGLEKLMIEPLRKRADWENKVMMLTLGLALFLTSLYTVVFDAKLKSLPPNP